MKKILEVLNNSEEVMEQYQADVIIGGGGMSGICAAIAAARNGVKVILVQDRPVLGGNASSEIRVDIRGAVDHAPNLRRNAREAGIIEELFLDFFAIYPRNDWNAWSTYLLEKCNAENNINIFLNSKITDIETDGPKIKLIKAVFDGREPFQISGSYFIDCTGDGDIAFHAKAAYMHGREDKKAFNERLALEHADHKTMGATLYFHAENIHRNVPYTAPEWAVEFDSNTFIKERYIHITDEAISGFWWVEYGGENGGLIPLTDYKKMQAIVLGVWDHIKNSGKYNAENYILTWIGTVPGKRESRRIQGEVILTENDILSGKIWEDRVAYGGWSIDIHPEQGLFSKEAPAAFTSFKDVYTIPLRALISRDFSNLLMAGRNISVSHVALGSTRVMATCALLGQAAGTAAAIACKSSDDQFSIENSESISNKYKLFYKKVQAAMLRDGVYIPGFSSIPGDFALQAQVKVSSSKYANVQILDGLDRPLLHENKIIYNKDNYQKEHKDHDFARVFNFIDVFTDSRQTNAWVSREMNQQGEWIEYDFKKSVIVSLIKIVFDSNVNRNYYAWHGPAPEIVKDYSLSLFFDGKEIFSRQIRDNHQKNNHFSFTTPLVLDGLRLDVKATNGAREARIFGIHLFNGGNCKSLES